MNAVSYYADRPRSRTDRKADPSTPTPTALEQVTPHAPHYPSQLPVRPHSLLESRNTKFR